MKGSRLDLRPEARGSETVVYMSWSGQKSPENPILFFKKRTTILQREPTWMNIDSKIANVTDSITDRDLHRAPV